MNIEIKPTQVRRAAASIESAADQVAKIDLAEPLADVAGAMPGHPAGNAASVCQSDWNGDKRAWVKAAHAHHQATTADTNAIVDADDQSATDGRRHASRVERNA